MRRTLALSALLLMLLLLVVLVQTSRSTTSSLTGTFKDANQQPLNGYITMRLPVPAVDTTTNTAVSSNSIRCNVVNGALVNCPPVYDVANLQPQNLYYITTAYDSSGASVFNANIVVTGTPFNLTAALPTSVTTSNISYINPATLSGNNTWTGSNTYTQPIISTVSTGTAPLQIASTTVVPNLNVQVLNGVTVSGTPLVGQVPTATSGAAATWQSPSSNPSYVNQSPTGTGVNLLAKLTGAPSTAVQTAITDTGGIIGICSTGCGNTGSSVITTVGEFGCQFDGATVAGDYVQNSATIAGNCHDTGVSYPSSGQVIGRVLSTNGASGVYTIALFATEQRGFGSIVTGQVFGSSTTYSTTAITANTPTGILSKAIVMPSSGCPCRALVSYSVAYTVGSQGITEAWVSDATNTFGFNEAGINAANLTNMGISAQDIGPGAGTPYANGANVTFTVMVEANQNITMVSPNFAGTPYLRVLVVTSN